MERKLKVKLSTFQTPLTFNEWVLKYNVSRDYVEPTPYFQGNPSTGYETLIQKDVPDPLATRIGRVCASIVTSIKSPF
jgi:hypothetical protein